MLKKKKVTAYHESGHLIVLYRLHPTDDVFKASIGARDTSLGVVYHLPKEEYFTQSKEVLLANIKTALGGYVAERMIFGGDSSNGVHSDFQNAMTTAHSMVWVYGMGDTGHIGDYSILPEHQISEQLKNDLNKETNKILTACMVDVEELLKKQIDLLHRFAEELLNREELEYDDIEEIIKDYDGPDSSGVAANSVDN